jgi:hypothetical protein
VTPAVRASRRERVATLERLLDGHRSLLVGDLGRSP